MRKHTYILENYLINHVFRMRFPFGVTPQGQPNDAYTEFLSMCVQYGMIKGLLIGMAGHYRGAFSPTHVVKLVSSFARAVEHCPDFLGIKDLGLDSRDGVAILLRN